MKNSEKIVYFVVFGDNKYSPDRCFNACEHKFNYLKDARLFAKEYSNSHVFKGIVGSMGLMVCTEK